MVSRRGDRNAWETVCYGSRVGGPAEGPLGGLAPVDPLPRHGSRAGPGGAPPPVQSRRSEPRAPAYPFRRRRHRKPRLHPHAERDKRRKDILSRCRPGPAGAKGPSARRAPPPSPSPLRPSFGPLDETRRNKGRSHCLDEGGKVSE